MERVKERMVTSSFKIRDQNIGKSTPEEIENMQIEGTFKNLSFISSEIRKILHLSNRIKGFFKKMVGGEDSENKTQLLVLKKVTA